MLPLSPPPGYFKEINSIISKFIWNDKCPRIKLTTLQHPNSAGGLAVPNFELYYWSFQLKALHNWVDSHSTVSWRVIEADKVKPNRLQDILFTGTGKKGDNYKFGPVVANSIKIWKTVERRIGGPFKFCNSTPLWHILILYAKSSICPTPLVFFRPLFISDIKNQILSTSIRVFCLSSATFCSQSVWRSLVFFHFLSSYADWIAPSAGRPSVS